MLRETLVASGRADRAAKEVVAAAVSHANRCPYCVDVHGATLFGLAGTSDAAAVSEGRLGEVADLRLRAIATWAAGTGRTGEPAPPPFPVDQLPELGGVAVVFHYLNRIVNVFLAGSPFPDGMPRRLRPRILRLAGRMLRPATSGPRAPGTSADLLPDGRLPHNLAWAAPSPHVGRALAQSSAAIEAAAEKAVPRAVRNLVTQSLAGWDGEPRGLSRAWADEEAAGLAAGERAVARLALLTAIASYQVDQSVIDAVLADRPDDRRLIAITSWAAMAAAHRVGGRLAPAAPGK
jgi:AhpD family alkylhydroperoxidase